MNMKQQLLDLVNSIFTEDIFTVKYVKGDADDDNTVIVIVDGIRVFRFFDWDNEEYIRAKKKKEFGVYYPEYGCFLKN